MICIIAAVVVFLSLLMATSRVAKPHCYYLPPGTYRCKMVNLKADKDQIHYTFEVLND